MSTKYEHKKTPKYPQVVVRFYPDITSQSEDMILGTMGNALRDVAKCSQDEINDFYTEARKSHRSHLIATCRRWVTVQDRRTKR